MADLSAVSKVLHYFGLAELGKVLASLSEAK
jgi:hypothetical protein